MSYLIFINPANFRIDLLLNMQTTSILAETEYIMFKGNVMKLGLESVQQTVCSIIQRYWGHLKH